MFKLLTDETNYQQLFKTKESITIKNNKRSEKQRLKERSKKICHANHAFLLLKNSKLEEILIDPRVNKKHLEFTVTDALKEIKYETLMTKTEYETEVFLHERERDELLEQQSESF